MKVPEHIASAGKPLISFEILPPTKGSSIELIFDNLDPLMEFSPPYINITFHQPEMVLKSRPDGLIEAKVVRKRPGTVAISAAIQNRYRIDVVPHLICGGFNQEETEDALIDLHYLGINNVLAIRGDGDTTNRMFVPKTNGHQYAEQLVKQIVRMNRGQYLEEDLANANPTDFSIGVAGYPEKHAESPNPDMDIQFLKKKVDAGAEYVVTQMFFDNQKFFTFVEKCREAGIDIPIIPGLKPISIKKHLNLLPQTFKVDIPLDLAKEVEKCKNNSEVRELGIEWGIAQTKELVDHGIPVVHFFTMGKADNIRKIVKAVF